MKKALILGGSGFLGFALAQTLRHSRNIRIYSPSAEKIIEKNEIETVTGYIADFGNLQPHLSWADEIYHFVSTTNPKSSFADPSHDITSNLVPLIPILEFLKVHPEKYFVFCSSGGAVYGQSPLQLIEESHPKNPQSSYGIVKSTMEDYIQYYQRLFGFKALILRPSNIYGLKKHDIGRQGLISTLLQNVINNRPTEIWVPISTSKDYLYIDDFLDAVIELVKDEITGIFNIASGQVHDIQEIINFVEKASKVQPIINIFSKPYSKIDVPVRLSSAKIKKLIGWQPKYDLERGINNLFSLLN